MKYNKIVIGIDQSYANTGVGIAADGKLLKVTSIPLEGFNSNTAKRKHISNIISLILKSNLTKASEMLIICERIRTFSGGFISTNYIKATGALIATIVDAVDMYELPVYSVDTRCWKSAILGKAQAGKGEDKKLAAIEHIMKLGFCNIQSTSKKGKITYNDDAADAGCIALSGFNEHVISLLKQEKF